jgi:hypothetical protein
VGEAESVGGPLLMRASIPLPRAAPWPRTMAAHHRALHRSAGLLPLPPSQGWRSAWRGGRVGVTCAPKTSEAKQNTSCHVMEWPAPGGRGLTRKPGRPPAHCSVYGWGVGRGRGKRGRGLAPPPGGDGLMPWLSALASTLQPLPPCIPQARQRPTFPSCPSQWLFKGCAPHHPPSSSAQTPFHPPNPQPPTHPPQSRTQ